MKRLFTLLYLFFYALQLGAQTLHVDSTRFVTGTTVGTSINYAIPTADKGILFVGFDYNNPGGIIPNSPYGGYNAMIGKIDSNQKISWVKVYGGNDDDAGTAASQTPDGGYAVLCGTQSNDGDVTGFKGQADMWLLRLDASGNLLWEKCYGSTLADAPLSIANTPDHGFVLLGLTNGSDGDVPFHYGSTLLSDWLVIKTDSAGNIQWSKDVGGTEGEGFGSILAADNGYYIACTSASIDHDCSDTAWHPDIPGTGTGNNYFLVKLDSTGSRLWDSSYGGSTGDEISYAMFDSRDSSIMMIGGTSSNDYMVTGYQGSGDMWVVKVDKNGKLIWERALGDSTPDAGNGICIAPSGGYLAYGGTSGVIGEADCRIVLLDSDGNDIVDHAFGGTSVEHPSSIVTYLNGYAAVGNSGSSVFTEGSCNINYSGAFVSYIGYWPLWISDLKEKKQIFIYPNPAYSSISIAIPKNEKGTITIQNVPGQVVFDRQTNEQKVNINASEWAAGLYLIKWQGEDGEVLTAKVVKE